MNKHKRYALILLAGLIVGFCLNRKIENTQEVYKTTTAELENCISKHTAKQPIADIVSNSHLRFIYGRYLENNMVLTTDDSLWILEDFEGYVGDSLLIAYDANDTISKIDDIIIDYANIKLQGGFMQWQD